MPKIYQRAAARRDLVDQFVYLAENAGLATAERFLANVEKAFVLLTTQPYIGAVLSVSRPEFVGLRKWHVEDFENVLIFYLPRADGVSIVRVLHAARDWWGLLGLEA